MAARLHLPIFIQKSTLKMQISAFELAFLLSVGMRTAQFVILRFVASERCAYKNRRGRYQFPISGVNRDISVSTIYTEISNLKCRYLYFIRNSDICISNTDI